MGAESEYRNQASGSAPSFIEKEDMEYAVCLSKPGPLPRDPRRLCPEKWRKLLPEGTLRAVYFGTEFCQDLLPGAKEAESFCTLAKGAGLEAVLLTPVVRADGLCRIQALIADLENRGMTPTVVCNDFGVLRMLRNQHPKNRRQAGRLINRALRDPRLAGQPPNLQGEEAARGGKIRTLLLRYDIAGLETDPDLEGSYLGDGETGLQRVLHLPYVFTASGRNCLLKAEAQKEDKNFAKWLSRSCPAPCRERWHAEERADLGFPLWRAGNTLFYEAPRTSVEAHLRRADRVVVHKRPMP
jgi:hypothetical protein